MRQTTLHDPFLNPFHDHDEASEPPPPNVSIPVPTESGSQQYISFFKLSKQLFNYVMLRFYGI